ncbi:hypothetical protein Hanom_Chr09g00817371 [Helianthus anomalus]
MNRTNRNMGMVVFVHLTITEHKQTRTYNRTHFFVHVCSLRKWARSCSFI